MKEGYKLTELGEIPEDWEVKEINDVCKLINGRGFKPYEWRKKGFPIIRIQNLNGSEDFNYFNGSFNKKILIENGQLLFAWSGSVGTSFGPHIWKGDSGVLNYHTWKINTNTKKATKDYLLYILKQLTKKIEESAHGASALVHVQKWEIEKFLIPVPKTIIEQTAIAKVLSNTDVLIQSLEKLIVKKQSIKQGTMQTLLTGNKRLTGFSNDWKVKRLGEIVDVVMGQSPLSGNYNKEGNGLPLIQGNADIVNHKSIQRIWTSQITKVCKKGNVIMTVRAPVGAVGIASENSCVGRGVCALLNKKCERQFLFYLLLFKEADWKILEQGSTFTSANSSQIKSFEVKVPTEIDEQTAIATMLKDMDNEISSLQNKLHKLRLIKQGMMQTLLTGKIRLL